MKKYRVIRNISFDTVYEEGACAEEFKAALQFFGTTKVFVRGTILDDMLGMGFNALWVEWLEEHKFIQREPEPAPPKEKLPYGGTRRVVNAGAFAQPTDGKFYLGVRKKELLCVNALGDTIEGGHLLRIDEDGVVLFTCVSDKFDLPLDSYGRLIVKAS
jgi:hypothetical protein